METEAVHHAEQTCFLIMFRSEEGERLVRIVLAGDLPGVLGIDDMPYTIESFADGQTLRPYFNTHCFAFNPAAGMGQA
jgi:hypothetical protein